jgi:UDP-glucose 4-epimerase
LDLLDEEQVHSYLKSNRFDVIVHAAGTRANRRLGAPPDLLDRNCRMFFNLARDESLFGRMIYFGSGAEYDRRYLPPRVAETFFDRHVPSDAYGFSKYICAKYAEHFPRIVNLRLFGVFGRYEAWDVRFISNACCRVVHALPIVIRQNVAFDYLYIDDLAALTRWFIANQPRYPAYNVCTGKSTDLVSLARLVATASGQNPEIVVNMPGMAPEYSGDNGLLMSEMGGYQFRDPADCIGELLEWYKGIKNEIQPALLRFDG